MSIVAVVGLMFLAFRPPPQPPQFPGFGGGRPGGGGRFGGDIPMPVTTAIAVKGDMPVTVDGLLGTIVPLATITVRSQIAGLLTEVPFQEGQMVHQGDLLALVDPRPYQHALEQMEGQLKRDQALLKNAELDQTRYKTLLDQDSIAKQQLDTQEALVLQYRGTVQTDQAQVETAKLNLDYCYIRAPLTGRAGLRLVDSGNYITVGATTGIAVITQMQPITAIFPVPEDRLPPILQRLRQKVVLPVTAYDGEAKVMLAKGEVSSIDNQIDTTTGTVKLRALFPNADETLFPNQFVSISLLVDTIHDATIVPSSAIQRGAPGTYVYVIGSGNTGGPDGGFPGGGQSTGIIGKIRKLLGFGNGSGDPRGFGGNFSANVGGTPGTVSVRPVKLGVSSGERIVIESGLVPGDVVVTDGADRLKDGAPVIASNADQPNDGGKPGADNAQAPGAPGDRPRRHGPPQDGLASSGTVLSGGLSGGPPGGRPSGSPGVRP